MVDRQFMHQNGMVIPSPYPITPTPEPKWVSPDISEKHDTHKRILRHDHLSMMDRLILFLAEFLGTAILVFLGCAGCVKFKEGSGPGALEVALAFGMAILIAVQCVGHISGAHINPAVTVAALIMGVTPLIQVPLYLGGQFLGSLTGYGLLKALMPHEYIKRSQDNVSLCSPEPNPNLQDAQVVFMEFLMTLFLIFVICSAWDTRNSTKLDSFSLKLGFVVAGLALVGGGFSGAHLNPARTFGPALINGDWASHWNKNPLNLAGIPLLATLVIADPVVGTRWSGCPAPVLQSGRWEIYWVGPILAGIVGGFVYKFLLQKQIRSIEEGTNGVVTPVDKT